MNKIGKLETVTKTVQKNINQRVKVLCFFLGVMSLEQEQENKVIRQIRYAIPDCLCGYTYCVRAVVRIQTRTLFLMIKTKKTKWAFFAF